MGQTEKRTGPSRAQVMAALDNCYDPCCRDRKISVVDMGLIERIDVDEQDVGIEMVLTSGWCPFVARLYEMVEEEVAALPGVDSVNVEVTWTTPWTPERMSEGARNKLQLPLESLLPLREARLKGAPA